jgi:beta-glucosidase
MTSSPPHPSTDGALESRVEQLLDQLTPDERASLTAGSGPWHTTPVDRIGLPALKLTDGPIGARGDGKSGATALCLPCGSVLGATWDPELLREIGVALGDEARTKNAQVLLGPTINLHRHPLGGRHFECYSEDPHLTGRLAVGWITGVQSRGVGASVKHFVANDTETERFSISSDVPEAALRELYLRPFEMAVRDADPWTIMGAYNRLHGTHCCQSRRLLTEVLRDEWGYRGLVVSDWGAVHDTVETARSGLDLEMPGPASHLGEHLGTARSAGLVTDADVDRMARNVLTLLVRSGRVDDDAGPTAAGAEEPAERSVDLAEHRALARRAAAAGTVLLHDRGGMLPLDPGSSSTLAVVGPAADGAQLLGGGSAVVRPHHQMQPLEALRERLGADRVRHARGCDSSRFLPRLDPSWLRPGDDPERPATVTYTSEPDGSGDVLQQRNVRGVGGRWFGYGVPGIDIDRFSCRYTATLVPPETATYTFGAMATGRVFLGLDGETVIDTFDGPPPPDPLAGSGPREVLGEVHLEGGRTYELDLLYGRQGVVSPPWVQLGVAAAGTDDAGIAEAADLAARCDVAVVLVGTDADWETEGYDRADLALPGRQDELVRRVVDANPRTVVVVNAGAPVDLSATDDAAAVLWAGFAGQEMGGGLADVLVGDADPGGRLPFTLPRRLDDTPAHRFYPGRDGHMPYGEGLLMGYRGFDAAGTEPHYPFGHGRSYATFDWSVPEIDGVVSAGRLGTDAEGLVLSVAVTNSSERRGSEVVQVYAHDPRHGPDRPPQHLVGFAKVDLGPAERAEVSIEIAADALASWDTGTEAWVVAPGERELRVARSSRDVVATLSLAVG